MYIHVMKEYRWELGPEDEEDELYLTFFSTKGVKGIREWLSSYVLIWTFSHHLLIHSLFTVYQLLWRRNKDMWTSMIIVINKDHKPLGSQLCLRQSEKISLMTSEPWSWSMNRYFSRDNIQEEGASFWAAHAGAWVLYGALSMCIVVWISAWQGNGLLGNKVIKVAGSLTVKN